MATLGETRRKKGKGGPPVLKGSVVPAKVSSFTIKVKELREAPDNFNAMALLDFAEPVFGGQAGGPVEGYSTMALNITNLKVLATRCGFDEGDFDQIDFADLAHKAKGKKLTITTGMANNPTTGHPTRTLFIA